MFLTNLRSLICYILQFYVHFIYGWLIIFITYNTYLLLYVLFILSTAEQTSMVSHFGSLALHQLVTGHSVPPPTRRRSIHIFETLATSVIEFQILDVRVTIHPWPRRSDSLNWRTYLTHGLQIGSLSLNVINFSN